MDYQKLANQAIELSKLIKSGNAEIGYLEKEMKSFFQTVFTRVQEFRQAMARNLQATIEHAKLQRDGLSDKMAAVDPTHLFQLILEQSKRAKANQDAALKGEALPYSDEIIKEKQSEIDVHQKYLQAQSEVQKERPGDLQTMMLDFIIAKTMTLDLKGMSADAETAVNAIWWKSFSKKLIRASSLVLGLVLGYLADKGIKSLLGIKSNEGSVLDLMDLLISVGIAVVFVLTVEHYLKEWTRKRILENLKKQFQLNVENVLNLLEYEKRLIDYKILLNTFFGIRAKDQ